MSNNSREPEMPGRPTREKPPGIRIWKKPTDEQELLRRRVRKNLWRRIVDKLKELPASIRYRR